MALTRHVPGLGVGVGTGVLGVLAHAVTAVIVLVLGESLVRGPITLPAFAAPLETVASLAIGLSVATPLLAAVFAFYVVATDRGDLVTVVAGLLPGGLVYGVGYGALYWVAFVYPHVTPLPWVRSGLWLGVVFAGFGALGALAGDLLSGHVRSRIGSKYVPR